MAWYLVYASSDQLARNLVQHTRLLAFPANAQIFSACDAKSQNGDFVVAEGGVSEIKAAVF
jgi:hypothetical protein